MRLLHLVALLGIYSASAERQHLDPKRFALEHIDGNSYDVIYKPLAEAERAPEAEARAAFRPKIGVVKDAFDLERLRMKPKDDAQRHHKHDTMANEKPGSEEHAADRDHAQSKGKNKHAAEHQLEPNKHADSKAKNKHAGKDHAADSKHANSNAKNEHVVEHDASNAKAKHKEAAAHHAADLKGAAEHKIKHAEAINANNGVNHPALAPHDAAKKPAHEDGHRVFNFNQHLAPAASPQEGQQPKAHFFARPVGDPSSSCPATITSTVTLPPQTATVTVTRTTTTSTTTTTTSSSTPTSSMSITSAPQTYTTSARPSACTGTSAQCPCASGYSCLLVSECEWECVATASATPTA